MTMQEQGFRLIASNNAVSWAHETAMTEADVDCTDMSDAEFEAQVCRTIGIFAFATVPS